MDFILDMDETLIFSNEANFFSYKKAFELVLKENFILEYDNSRLNSKNLKKFFPNLTQKQLVQIKKEKMRLYPRYLSYTKINQRLLDEILKQSKTHKVFLCTDAAKWRVQMLIKYHHLDFLSEIYCNKKGNKFLNLLNHYTLNPKDLIVFEDDDIQIAYALQAGILEKNIIKIGGYNERA